MSQNLPFKPTAFIIVYGAVVQFVLQVSLLTKGLEYAAVSLLIDDTYYYLQTAWNTKVLGFVTFDGLHPTNGVQLLWFVIILLLALLVKTKAVLLFTTLSLSFLLNALCYLVILRIGTVLKQPALALFMASLWALQSLPFRIYSMGMENSLHALIFWCAIWQCTEFLIRVRGESKPNVWSLSAVLILNAWTRLDSALLSALLFAFCMGTLAYAYRQDLRLLWQQHGKAIAGSSLLAAVGLAAQLTAFRLMGGSFLPVSALIKTSGAGQASGVQPIERIVEIFTLGMPAILQGRFPALVLLLIGISGVLLVFLARMTFHNIPHEIGVLFNLWSCLLAGELIYDVYVALSGVEYRPYFIWYRSPSFIFWVTTGSLLALLAILQIRLDKHAVEFLKWAPVGCSVALFAAAVYLFGRGINFTSELYIARYNAALWLAEHSPPDAVLASWNAGQLGFFSNRTVINLDGLINDIDYYERVLRGTTPLAEYLVENEVDYIVDYSIYRPIPDYPIVQTFPLNDETGRSIQIWQVSPQLTAAP